MTPRDTVGLCCAHIAQLMTHPAIYTLPFTLQLCYKPLGILQRVTKLLKQLAYVSFTDNHYLLICTSGEDCMKKITSI